MAWDGWIQFDGNEIINVSRTEAYAKSLGLYWVKEVYNNDSLHHLVGDDEYRTPLLDPAPWMDDDVPESADFIGFYPLAITGIEGSTRDATVVESIGNGGSVRGVRFGTKTIVFNGMILAASEDGAEYGLRWLKQVVNGAPCGGGTDGVDCNGADMCYLSAEPVVDPPIQGMILGSAEGGYGGGGYGDGLFGGFTLIPETLPYVDLTECLAQYLRTFRNVTVTQGPLPLSKRRTSDGGAVWNVTLTAVVGNPYEFAVETPIIEGFLDPQVQVPWASGITEGTYDDMGHVINEAPCDQPIFTPVFDPLCPTLIPPPQPAQVRTGCFDVPENWVRRQVSIPPQYVTLWGDMVPVVNIHARLGEVRNVRLRFYADPYGTGDPEADPCSFCGDILVTYVPKDSTLVLDGVSETVYVEKQGEIRRRADSLVYGTDGKPFNWPALTCGMGYIVTVDMPQTYANSGSVTTPLPVLDLSLTARVI